MKKQDNAAPATKGDVKLILTHLSFTEKRIGGVENRMRGVEKRMDRLEERFGVFEDRIIRYIDVKFEQQRHDLVGATKDDIQGIRDRVHDHEFRLQRLEG